MCAIILLKFVNTNVVLETTQEVIDALRMFGFSNFRQGQESAIMRVLCGWF